MVIYNIKTNGPSSSLVIELINDTVFVEPTAVAYVSGHIQLIASKGGVGTRCTAFFIGQNYFKPCYKGSGKIYIKSTIGTYHKFTIKEDNKLLIANDAFIACRDTITISPQLRPSFTKFISGAQMINTQVHGNGNVVVLMPGPVQEVKLTDDKFVAYNSDIAAYSSTLRVTRERAGKGWLNIARKMVKVYKGSGSIFFSPHPNKGTKVSK